MANYSRLSFLQWLCELCLYFPKRLGCTDFTSVFERDERRASKTELPDSTALQLPQVCFVQVQHLFWMKSHYHSFSLLTIPSVNLLLLHRVFATLYIWTHQPLRCSVKSYTHECWDSTRLKDNLNACQYLQLIVLGCYKRRVWTRKFIMDSSLPIYLIMKLSAPYSLEILTKWEFDTSRLVPT